MEIHKGEQGLQEDDHHIQDDLQEHQEPEEGCNVLLQSKSLC